MLRVNSVQLSYNFLFQNTHPFPASPQKRQGFVHKWHYGIKLGQGLCIFITKIYNKWIKIKYSLFQLYLIEKQFVNNAVKQACDQSLTEQWHIPEVAKVRPSKDFLRPLCQILVA